MVTPIAADVRCPHCGKKLAEVLRGELIVVCPRCKERVSLSR